MNRIKFYYNRKPTYDDIESIYKHKKASLYVTMIGHLLMLYYGPMYVEIR